MLFITYTQLHALVYCECSEGTTNVTQYEWWADDCCDRSAGVSVITYFFVNEYGVWETGSGFGSIDDGVDCKSSIWGLWEC